MRNLLAKARHHQRQMIAALIRTIFAQPDAATASTQLRAVVDQLEPVAPEVAALLACSTPQLNNRIARTYTTPRDAIA